MSDNQKRNKEGYNDPTAFAGLQPVIQEETDLRKTIRRLCRWRRTVTLCGRCINLIKDDFRVQESGRRQKITCEACGKRRYGADCKLEKKR